MYWPLGVVVLVSIVPITAHGAALPAEYTRLSRLAQDQAGHVATHVEESALGCAWSSRSAARTTSTTGSTSSSPTSTTPRSSRVSVSAKFWTLLEVIPNLTLIIVLGFGAYAAGHGYVTMGTLVAFITMMLSLVWPIASLGFLLSMTQESFTAANRIAEIFDAPREIADGPTDRPRAAAGSNSSTSASGSRTARRWALRHVNVTVEPGETLALVGSTGSGKSVLAALLSRLYDVTEGAIRIDGTTSASCRWPRCARPSPPRSRTRRCSRCRSPRTCGWAGPHATDDEIAQAIEVAAAQFVYDLPFGLDTRIGEQGMSLSGGQRQRLSLARAILAAPKILVLDDTLSALDVHTEAVVEEALRRVLHAVTGIVVAHRASTVLLADRVALLRGRHHHPRRHARRAAGRPCRSTATCWPPTTNSTTAPSAACAWQDDEDRSRLDRPRGAGGR